MARTRFPWKAVTIGGALLGAGILLAKRSSKSAPVNRVALIGDSYAVGLGWGLAKLFSDFKWEGHVGTRTAQWAAHSGCGTCGDWLAEFKPDVVLVSLGVNDGTLPNRANFENIVRGIQSLGARVVWIEPPATVPTAARAVIESLGVQTVRGPSLPLAADGLHPTEAGYQIWAQQIAEALRG